MNEQKPITPNEKSVMSPFCEELMEATDAVTVGNRNANDAAIVLCTDGRTIGARQCGLYPTVLQMFYTKMLNDDKFAEVVMEVSMMYSRNLLGKFHKPFKEDAPIKDTIIKPIN